MNGMYSILHRRRLRWFGHVKRMNQSRIPIDLLYCELVEGSRPWGSPHLRYKDLWKRDLKACNINTDTWVTWAQDLSAYHIAVKQGVLKAEKRRTVHLVEWRGRRKAFLLATSASVCFHTRHLQQGLLIYACRILQPLAKMPIKSSGTIPSSSEDGRSNAE